MLFALASRDTTSFGLTTAFTHKGPLDLGILVSQSGTRTVVGVIDVVVVLRARSVHVIRVVVVAGVRRTQPPVHCPHDYRSFPF